MRGKGRHFPRNILDTINAPHFPETRQKIEIIWSSWFTTTVQHHRSAGKKSAKADPHTASFRANQKAKSLDVQQLFARHCLEMVCSLFSLYLNRVDNSGLRRANSWATSSEFAFQFALKCNVYKLDLRPSPPKKTTMLSVTVSPMAKLTHNLKKVAGIFDVPTVLSAPRKLKNLSSCSKCFHPIFSSQTTKISSGADV